MTDQDIDPGTGMPVVPRGHFWQIKKWDPTYGGYLYQVVLRRAILGRLISVKVESNLGKDSDPAEVRKVARRVLNKQSENLIQKAKQKKVNGLFGTYPPHKLEDK